MDKVWFAGVPFCVASPAEAAELMVQRFMNGRGGMSVHFLNAYSVALSDTDSQYRSCVVNSTINFPDGKPIAVLSRIGSRKLHQVRGPGFFEDVMGGGRKSGIRHYLLGATPETLKSLEESLRRRYPGVNIVGSFSPPFRELLPAERVTQDAGIRAAGADVVWVGLGTPKQDFEVERLAAEGFNAVAIGAAFDFSAGTKREAPSWVTVIGLEWLHRLLSEPRRLWKRYLFGNALFLRAVLKHGLSSN